VYFGKPVCDFHWEKYLASENPRTSEHARKTLGLPAKLEYVKPLVVVPGVLVAASTFRSTVANDAEDKPRRKRRVKVEEAPVEEIPDASDEELEADKNDEVDEGGENDEEQSDESIESSEPVEEQVEEPATGGILSRIQSGEFDMEI
jgi:hypothetical protein